MNTPPSHRAVRAWSHRASHRWRCPPKTKYWPDGARRSDRHGKECLTLHLQMYVGAKDPRDVVEVQGAPPVDLTVEGGIFGDTATVGMLINVAPLVEEVSAGLKTMKDLPMPRAFGRQPARQ